MKIILAITLTILFLGCNTSQRPKAELNAVTAKTALLDLMRSEGSPFEGATPARFEKIELQDKGEGTFGWGAFTIDVNKKTYFADVVSPSAFWFYNGKFIVNSHGQWQAKNLLKQHGSSIPSNKRHEAE